MAKAVMGARASTRRRRLALRLAAAPLALLALADSAQAEPPPLTRTTFGTVGLIDMPSARMAADGTISGSGSYFQDTQRYALSFQALPWLETQFRYAGLQHFNIDFPVLYDRSFAVKARLWDESGVFPAVAVGFNDLVGTGIYGGEYLVASKQFGPIDATIGMGWGRLGTANTIRNPLGVLSKSFYDRANFEGEGGNFNINQYFHSPRSGIFGGVSWRTPVDGLTLLAEYSSDAYTLETSRGNFHPNNQFNVGASYELFDGINTGLYWMYGKVVGASASFQFDPSTPAFPQKIGTQPPSTPLIRSPEEQQTALNTMVNRPGTSTSFPSVGFVEDLWKQKNVADAELRGQTLFVTVVGAATPAQCAAIGNAASTSVADVTQIVLTSPTRKGLMRCTPPPSARRMLSPTVWNPSTPIVAQQAVATIDASGPPKRSRSQAMAEIRKDAKAQTIPIIAADFEGATANIYFVNVHYFSTKEVIERLTAILMKDAPPDIEQFRLVAVVNELPQRETIVLRSPQERAYVANGQIDLFSEYGGTQITGAPMANPVLSATDRKTYPKPFWSIDPIFRQELFDPVNPVGVQLAVGAFAYVNLTRGLSLQTEVDTSVYQNFNLSRPGGSALPPVRTDFTKYIEKGGTGIGNLEADYRFRLTPDVFAIARAGYVEQMFGGAGGEILWRPQNQRWALGVDLYEVWQRNYDRLFGFKPYHVMTGHVSLYYAAPWYNLNFAVRAGQYLAGDRGITFEITRRFATGVEVGAFFTRTNVSAQQFGEGSFDKGIIIRIPLGAMIPLETQGEYATILRPIQRDGGQRLYGDTLLYDETRRASQVELENQLGASSKEW